MLEKAKMASTVGLEPTTPGLEVRCAIHCATLTDGYPPNFSLFKDLGKLGKFIYFFIRPFMVLERDGKKFALKISFLSILTYIN